MRMHGEVYTKEEFFMIKMNSIPLGGWCLIFFGLLSGNGYLLLTALITVAILVFVPFKDLRNKERR